MISRTRLAALEARVGAPDTPTWAQVRDAEHRAARRARARFAAVLDPQGDGASRAYAPAADDQAAVDEATVRRYHAARGLDLDEARAAAAPAARARLAAEISRRLDHQ
jgi:hypothetical protein